MAARERWFAMSRLRSLRELDGRQCGPSITGLRVVRDTQRDCAGCAGDAGYGDGCCGEFFPRQRERIHMRNRDGPIDEKIPDANPGRIVAVIAYPEASGESHIGDRASHLINGVRGVRLQHRSRRRIAGSGCDGVKHAELLRAGCVRCPSG